MTNLGSIIGRGIAFPPHLGPDGRLRFSEGAQNVREAIEVILRTDQRERVMNATFGAGLQSFLFEPNVGATHAVMEDRMRRSLTRWEPRIRVDNLSVEADPDDPQAAVVTLAYRLVATDETDQFSLSVQLAG